MRHSLRAFAQVPARRHIAVLGSMAELGTAVVARHEETGADAAAVELDALYCGGDHAQALARGALTAGMPATAVHTYVTNAEIAETLRSLLQDGDALLLKGSRVQRMEEILDALLATRRGDAAAPAPRTPEKSGIVSLSGSAPAALAPSDVAAFGAAARPRSPARTFTINASGLPPRIVALPIRTQIVRSGDDLVRLVTDSVRGIAGRDDVVCVSETAVAIAQGRSIPAEAIRPSRLARYLADQAGSYATMSQPESVQLVIEKVGTMKVLAAVAAGAAGKLLGRSGDFYRALGPAVAEIDGYTGTMPPFERHIVLGPVEPDKVAEMIAGACGAHVAIVDANDLEKVDVLGASAGVNAEAVCACLRSNPHGNSDQQTPLVILKYRPVKGSTPASPLLL
jgi:F420-0:gamma-glutamyl ligase